MVDMNSMLYWYPRIKDLDIPQPRTRIYMLPDWFNPFELAACIAGEKDGFDCKTLWSRVRQANEELDRLANEIGYPLFARSDQTSCKHHIVDGEPLYLIKRPMDFSKLWMAAVECHELIPARIVNPPAPKAFVLREWLDIETWTTLPGKLSAYPYNRVEVRLFAKNGEVYSGFPYYHISGLLARLEMWGMPGSVIEKVRKDYKQYVHAVIDDLPTLVQHASKATGKLGGDWSVDFAKSKQYGWTLIDMAVAEDSYFPDPEDMVDLDQVFLDKLHETVRGRKT